MPEPAGGTPRDVPVRLVRRGSVVTIDPVADGLTVLDWLREVRGERGTKEGCREGDCGACTVVIAEPDPEGRLRYRPIDACITLLRSIDGCALWTVADLAAADGTLHPVQQALIDQHASQCGFCTPGVVMALFALYQQHLRPLPPRTDGDEAALAPVHRDEAVAALAGNLCRCTGYRSILAAAAALPDYPPVREDDDRIAGLLATITPQNSLADVLAQRRDRPAAVVVAGGTDVLVAQAHTAAPLAEVIALRTVPELRRIDRTAATVVIGAAVPLADAWTTLAADRPVLADYAARFAGPQVRSTGTLGGNIAMASPIGDSLPVLLALDARIHVASADRARVVDMADMIIGYHRTALAPDELIVAIEVPQPPAGERLHVAKHSRHHDDDISAVSLAVRLILADGMVTAARVAVGGVAATASRAPRAEAMLEGRPWSAATVGAAAEALAAEFEPIDDVRAGSRHRRLVLEALLNDVWDGSPW